MNELVVGVYLGDTVDADVEVRSGTVSTLVEEGNAVLGSDYVGLGLEVACVVNVCEVLGESLAANGEGSPQSIQVQ